MGKLKEMLELNISEKSPIHLYFDIETFQYNEAEAKKSKKTGKAEPSLYKNKTFSVAVSWMVGDEVDLEVFPGFKEMFNTILEVFGKVNKKKIPRFMLTAHNTNKYDNHYLRYELLKLFPEMKLANMFLTTATTEESNRNALKLKDLKAADKKAIILEKRIKSSINLEMNFFLEGIQFETVDNWPKTNASIKVLGKKLKRLGVVTKEQLKTDFDYLKYNKEEDMTDAEAEAYAYEIFNSLSNQEIKYIENDVILLAKSVHHYSELFPGFDYSKRTFTSNILDAYNNNRLTSFQLLNRIGTKGDDKKDKVEVRYTDYKFANENFYDYLKPFYRGGLNFYNQFQMGKIIEDGVFTMDINSSYPFAMHNFKIPTYLKKHESFDTITEVPVNYSDDEYTLFRISKETFDYLVLDEIRSLLLKQILVKYYSTNEFININTYTFKMIENVVGLRFDTIPVYSYITFETEMFGARKEIEEFYQVKTQGKNKKKLKYENPYDIELTDEINDIFFSDEEVALSKIILNGIYGIPALRAYFNLFRMDENGKLYNVENGHKNAERNILFSIFVTSVSLWNLLNPLKYLTAKEIDENLLYIDTDSLYMKQAVFHKMPEELFNKFNLGAWGLDKVNIPKFYVLNHKKYCYEAYDEDTGEMEIVIKAGGIPQETFNTDMSFEEFVETQFSDGVEINTLKSIYNNQGTISLYNAPTKLTMGNGYRIHAVGKEYDMKKALMFEEIRNDPNAFSDDVLYIESYLGTFSITDIYPVTHEVKQKEPLVFLEITQDKVKELINS